MNRQTTTAATSAWRARWQTLAPRERLLLAIAAAVACVLLLWAVAIAPAWRTLRDAPARRAALDAQLAQARAASAELQALHAAAPARDSRNPSSDQLPALTTRLLGDRAQVHAAGGEIRVEFDAAPAAALSQWLVRLRAEAGLAPHSLQIEAGGDGSWSGTARLDAAPAAGRAP